MGEHPKHPNCQMAWTRRSASMPPLKVREESGDTLDFIENGFIRDLAEKGTGIFGGEGTGVGVFERKGWKIRCKDPGKGRFSRLPGAGEAEDRFQERSELMDDSPFRNH